MSVKKHISFLSNKQYSFYEESPGEFLDETDVRLLHNRIFYVSQSHHGLAQVSEGSRKILAIELFQLHDLKNEQRYILEEEASISRKGLGCLIDSLRSLRAFDYYRKFSEIPLSKPKTDIGSTK